MENKNEIDLIILINDNTPQYYARHSQIDEQRCASPSYPSLEEAKYIDSQVIRQSYLSRMSAMTELLYNGEVSCNEACFQLHHIHERMLMEQHKARKAGLQVDIDELKIEIDDLQEEINELQCPSPTQCHSPSNHSDILI